MFDLYALIYEEEDYSRIYGIYNDYILCYDDLLNLRKYNESISYGKLKIIGFNVNKLYSKENLKYIE